MNKRTIQDKIRYYSQQQDKAVRDYLASTKRVDRDRVLKLTMRIDVYKEVLELINE